MTLKQRQINQTMQQQRGIFIQCSVWTIILSLMIALVACGNGYARTATTVPAATSAAAVSTPANTPSPAPTSASTPTPATGLAQVVQITNGGNGSFGFSPATLTIKVGTTITWKNGSSAPHTVTSDDGKSFDSGNILVSKTFRFKFTTAGTFPYHCNIHPYMRATIIVV